MNETHTLSFTYTELQKMQVALGYALTNPYISLETERALLSARDKVITALKQKGTLNFTGRILHAVLSAVICSTLQMMPCTSAC